MSKLYGRVKYVKRNGLKPGYWYVDGGVTQEDLEDLILSAGNRIWYLLIVVGEPCKVSDQWIAKHKGYAEGDAYEYAVSYSIHIQELENILYETEGGTIEETFNYYLDVEESGNCWKSIDRIEIVDQERWKLDQ